MNETGLQPRADLQGEVVLRRVIEADLPTLYAHQDDPEATQMAAFPARPYESFIKHWRRILADDTNTLETILFNGEVAGYIVSWDHDRRREVGYWLGRDYWGKGIATRALQALLERERVRPLYAYVARHNLASRRVLEKCGFSVVGSDRTLAGMPGEPVEEFILRLD